MHGHVGDVGAEAALRGEPVDELGRERHRHLVDGVAAEADEVDVRPVIGELIGRRAVVEMGVRDDAEPLERLERAVDGGRRQRGTAVARKMGDDLVRGGVSEAGERIDDPAPLGRQAFPVGAQHRGEVRHQPTVCRPRTITRRFAVRQVARGSRCRPGSADAFELGGQVRLQRLADRGHVHRVHEVAVDEAVEPGRRVVFLRVRAAHD